MVGREYSPGLASFRLGEHIEMRLPKKIVKDTKNNSNEQRQTWPSG